MTPQRAALMNAIKTAGQITLDDLKRILKDIIPNAASLRGMLNRLTNAGLLTRVNRGVYALHDAAVGAAPANDDAATARAAPTPKRRFTVTIRSNTGDMFQGAVFAARSDALQRDAAQFAQMIQRSGVEPTALVTISEISPGACATMRLEQLAPNPDRHAVTEIEMIFRTGGRLAAQRRRLRPRQGRRQPNRVKAGLRAAVRFAQTLFNTARKGQNNG